MSYQPKTFADVPVAIVSSLSNVHDAGEWMTSVDTSGSSEYSRYGASDPLSAAALNAANVPQQAHAGLHAGHLRGDAVHGMQHQRGSREPRAVGRRHLAAVRERNDELFGQCRKQ